MVEKLAEEHGTGIADAELIGLMPEAAYEADAAWVQQIPDFNPDLKILERRLASPLAWPEA
jgi:glutamate formiminotransferase